MYWVQNLVDAGDETCVIIAYFHIDPASKEVQVHTKVCKDEDEFILYYNKIKSL
jgi:hypothetical protein